MRILLIHGRNHPHEQLNDWGFSGPTIENVLAIHTTYGGDPNIFFESETACQIAKALTGWKNWDENALTMKTVDDLVKITDLTGQSYYFGDCEYQDNTTVAPIHKINFNTVFKIKSVTLPNRLTNRELSHHLQKEIIRMGKEGVLRIHCGLPKETNA